MVKVMLDFQVGGKAMPLESHRREEKVCMRPPLLDFVLISGLFISAVAMDTYHKFNRKLSG